ncbi:hypothetical protein ACIQTZ_03085 [Paenarthrobacter sp. NPDC090520]|uniref:hypothetical protein n=1 Tax=Paenarthrobacter sp. NPDC090520 TaxID=3364382 RepID=UPI0038189089
MTEFLPSLKRQPFTLRHEPTLNFVKKLCADYPAAEFHRKLLRELGCDFSYAAKDKSTGCWHTVIELNSTLQGLLGMNKGFQLTYTPFHELQSRTIESMIDQRIDRERSDSLYLLHTPDILGQRKVDNWSFRKTYSVIVMPSGGQPKDVALELLRRIVEASSRNNPYERTTPVSGVEFFGRSETIRSLSNEIRSGYVCGLFGLRKTGKTSLLSELGRLFQLGDPENSLYILQDLEVLPSNPQMKIPELISSLANQLQIDFKKQGMRTQELSLITKSSTAGDLRQAIEASLRKGVGTEKMVVLALDEVESLVSTDTSDHGTQNEVPEILGALRALVQENKNFNVVLSGITTSPIMSPTLFGRENPLFAWAKPTFVAEITKGESDRMISELGSRMAVRWTPAALESIYRTTGGQVFLTRSFAGYIASTLGDEITNRLISETKVKDSFRSWRRTALQLVDGMIDSLNRFYPTELSLLHLGLDTSFDELEDDFTAEISNLINLGVLVDSPAGLELSSWTKLGSKVKVSE